jgi:hypothetical protein
LTKAAETMIAEDNRASLCKHIAELKVEKNTLQCAVDNVIEDYDLLLEGNKRLLAERDDLCFCCEDLQAQLAEVRADAKKQIAYLEVKVESAEAHIIGVPVAGERRLKDFEDELIRDLAELHVARAICAQRSDYWGLMLVDARGQAFGCGLSSLVVHRDIRSPYVWWH